MCNLIEACDLSGISMVTLRTWIAQGLVKPERVGQSGPGSGYRFSPMTVIALGVVKQLQQTKRGWNPHYVPTVVEAFNNYGEEELREQFNQGKTHFIAIQYHNIILGIPDQMSDKVNVKAVYDRVVDTGVEGSMFVASPKG